MAEDVNNPTTNKNFPGADVILQPETLKTPL